MARSSACTTRTVKRCGVYREDRGTSPAAAECGPSPAGKLGGRVHATDAIADVRTGREET